MLLHALIAALSLSATPRPPMPPVPPVPPVPPAAPAPTGMDEDDDSDDVQQAMEDAREEVEQAREQMRDALQQVREMQRHRHRMFEVMHPRMGVRTSPSDNPVGARVEAVATGSPAEQAGLKTGDVITAINGKALDDRSDPDSKSRVVSRLLELIHQSKPGDKLAVDYTRGSDHKKATVALPKEGENMSFSFEGLPGNWNFINEAMAGFPFSGHWMNMELVNVDPELGEYFGTKEGLLVVRVPQDANVPLRSGDVILKIGDRQPKTPVQAVKIFRSYDPGDTVNIEVMRHKERKTLAVQVPGDGHTAGRSGHH